MTDGLTNGCQRSQVEEDDEDDEAEEEEDEEEEDVDAEARFAEQVLAAGAANGEALASGVSPQLPSRQKVRLACRSSYQLASNRLYQCRERGKQTYINRFMCFCTWCSSAHVACVATPWRMWSSAGLPARGMTTLRFDHTAAM